MKSPNRHFVPIVNSFIAEPNRREKSVLFVTVTNPVTKEHILINIVPAVQDHKYLEGNY